MNNPTKSPTNWVVGDLALCIKSGAWIHVGSRLEWEHPAPTSGEISAVVGLNGRGFLKLDRYQKGYFDKVFFIKIENHELDEYDLFVIREMKGEPPCQPVIPTPVTVPSPITEESELHPKSLKVEVIRGTMTGDVLPTRWTQFTG